jgi:hypothetical protein
MSPSISVRQITRAVSDGTGLTQEEAWVFVVVTASAAALTGLLRAVDAVIRAVDSLRDG